MQGCHLCLIPWFLLDFVIVAGLPRAWCDPLATPIPTTRVRVMTRGTEVTEAGRCCPYLFPLQQTNVHLSSLKLVGIAYDPLKPSRAVLIYDEVPTCKYLDSEPNTLNTKSFL